MRMSDTNAVSPAVGCRVVDADGTPLLSVASVEWSVDGDPAPIRVTSSPFDIFADGQASGARVNLAPAADAVPGEVTLRATYGELEETFGITLE